MKNKKWFKFAPNNELLAVLASWILVVGTLYVSFMVITISRVAAQFVSYGLICIMFLGILAPAAWNCLIKKRPLSSLGIKRDKLIISIGLGLLCSAVQYWITLRTIALPPVMEFIPLATMAAAVGLYENVFYRGWVQLRMEESFGIIPGILLSSIIYSLYHIGYGMNLNEMAVLFFVGLSYSCIFRLTSNIFIVYPFLTPTGALYSQIKEGLSLPFGATIGFSIVIVLSIFGLMIIQKIYHKKNELQYSKAVS